MSRGPSRRYVAVLAGGVTVIGVVVAVVVITTANHSSAPAAVSELPANLADVCSTPSSGFTRFWELSAGQPTDYSGTVQVGSARIPAMSMFTSDGPRGTGVLCVTTTALLGPQQPIRAAVLPKSGAIAYLGTYQDQPFGGVRPGVSRVTITLGDDQAEAQVFPSVGESPLASLGGGWHAFNSPYGYGSGEPTTVRAYDQQNILMDTVTISLPVPQTSAAPQTSSPSLAAPSS